MKLIDKDAVVAEIERRKKLVSDPILSGDDLMIGERNALFNLLSFINTLEVKEVDINKEISQFIATNLSVEEKAKRYDEAIKRASNLYKDAVEMENNMTSKTCEIIFPELKESEDEKIRKSIIAMLDNYMDDDNTIKPAIMNWIEKQGEKKPADKVKPMFHACDWITNGQLTCKVLGVTSKSYELHLYNDDYCHFETDVQSVDKYYHLWTIQDARDGDVLAFDDNTIVIFKDLYNATTFHSYCHIEDGLFGVNEDGSHRWEGEGFHPATKEQRDLLFQKLKNDGYEWDFENKEL